MVFILLSSGEVKIVCCCVKKDYTNKDNSKSFKNLKHNRQEIKDIMSLIFKAFEFWCVWGYGKREKKVAGADSCITTRPYTAEVVQCLCLWLHKRLRVRDVDHLSVTISLEQPEIPSSVFFIIPAVSVPCFSHNKHGTWQSRTWDRTITATQVIDWEWTS